MDIIEEGVNGHLVNPKDIDGLAERVLHVLELPENDWQNMSSAAYDTAIRYTWDDATDLFEKALAVAIDRSKRGDLPVSTINCASEPSIIHTGV